MSPTISILISDEKGINCRKISYGKEIFFAQFS
jgi:hypothetical protein